MIPPKTLKKYYKYYLTLHQNKTNRRLHVTGQLITISFILLVMEARLWPLLLFAPFIIYPFAWTGHYLFEKNEPAAFKDPVKAKLSDWMMFWDILRGKISIL